MARHKYDVPCKLGTIPHLVRVHGGDTVEPDRLLRIQERENAPWSCVLVRSVNPDGHFFADLYLSHAPTVTGAQPPAGVYVYPGE